MQYQLPRWLAARVVLTSLTWSTSDAGASLSIRVPRDVEIPFLYYILQSEEVGRCLSRVGILPTDITTEGHTLLTVRIPCFARHKPLLGTRANSNTYVAMAWMMWRSIPALIQFRVANTRLNVDNGM